MSEIKIIKTEVVYENKWLKMIKTRFLALHPEIPDTFRRSTIGEYFHASRDGELGVSLNAVVICAIHIGEDRVKRLVVTDEYRIPIQEREYGFPAGLIEKGMTVEETAVKELKEETGLDVLQVYSNMTTPIMVSSAGMSNEGIKMVFLTCSGTTSKEFQEPIEDINTQLLDFDQICRLVREPHVFSAKAYPMFYAMIFAGKIGFANF